jgi:TonB family protein
VSNQDSVTLTLAIAQNGETREETFAQDIIKVGKLPSNHLQIEDDKVSRMHAVIEVKGDEVQIIDLGSASGTLVNGTKINKQALSEGDEIAFGDATVTVKAIVFPEAEEVAAPSPAAPAPPAASPFAAAPMANPFAAPAAPAEGEGGKVVYGIAASGPPVNPSEVETGAAAVEVVVMWEGDDKSDSNIIHVAHLSPPRTYVLGSRGDYLMSPTVLGQDNLPVVVASGGQAQVVIPQGATGTVTIGTGSDAVEKTFEELAAGGKLSASSQVPGAQLYPLPQNATAVVKNARGLTIRAKATAAGKDVGGAFTYAWQRDVWIGVSLVAHAALLALFYFLPPASPALSVDALSQDIRAADYADTGDESIIDEPEPEFMDTDETADSGGTGERHQGEEGEMGEEGAERTNNRYGIAGDSDDPQMARANAEEAAATAAPISAVAAILGSWNSPTSPFGGDVARGNDPMSAIGNLMGDQIGTSGGFGGLGLTGTGRGGGGTGEGTIGLGRLGTIGHGAGGGTGSGYGAGAGGLGGRRSRTPRVRARPAEVRGGLSPDVIRRVVRRHLNEVRFCYEQQLNTRPDLQGRVTVNFIISGSGAVQSSAVRSSDLGNPEVERCIVQAVRRWTFPQPDGGGIVGVNYPFVLSPG